MPGPKRLEPYVAITAGVRIDGECAREAGTPVKALACVRGFSMLARRALDAVLAAPRSAALVANGSVVAAALAAILLTSCAASVAYLRGLAIRSDARSQTAAHFASVRRPLRVALPRMPAPPVKTESGYLFSCLP